MPSINLGRVVGDPGPKGDRGTVWHLGTGVTGQSTTGTVFSGSGVESAALQDMYLNTNTDDFYTCVLAGNAATAKWAYAGNLKGATGPQGATGPTGKVDSNTPVTFETAATETDINSGESLGTLMGKIKKSISTFRSAIGTLSTLKTNAKTSLVAAINEIFAANNDLSQEVSGKANANHTHTTSQISDIGQASVNYANSAGTASSAGAVPWSGVSGKPSSYTPSSHTHDDRYYTESETNNLLSQRVPRSISGDRTTKCTQDLLNIKVITSDATGANAVSGLDNYLIFHQAVDIRDAQQMYCFTVGFVNNNQYYYSTVSSKALSIVSNNVGTVSVQGGEAAFVKQVFIAIPQIGAAIL